MYATSDSTKAASSSQVQRPLSQLDILAVVVVSRLLLQSYFQSDRAILIYLLNLLYLTTVSLFVYRNYVTLLQAVTIIGTFTLPSLYYRTPNLIVYNVYEHCYDSALLRGHQTERKGIVGDKWQVIAEDVVGDSIRLLMHIRVDVISCIKPARQRQRQQHLEYEYETTIIMKSKPEEMEYRFPVLI